MSKNNSECIFFPPAVLPVSLALPAKNTNGDRCKPVEGSVCGVTVYVMRRMLTSNNCARFIQKVFASFVKFRYPAPLHKPIQPFTPSF